MLLQLTDIGSRRELAWAFRVSGKVLVDTDALFSGAAVCSPVVLAVCLPCSQVADKANKAQFWQL